MRKINKIILHCSLSDVPAHDDIAIIDQWHKERGWKGVLHNGKRIYCGYHYFLTSNGKLQYGRPIGDAGAHCRGHNHDSIGICLHGKDRFHPAQFGTLRKLLESLDFALRIKDVYGHCDFDSKKPFCPGFDYKAILAI